MTARFGFLLVAGLIPIGGVAQQADITVPAGADLRLVTAEELALAELYSSSHDNSGPLGIPFFVVPFYNDYDHARGGPPETAVPQQACTYINQIYTRARGWSWVECTVVEHVDEPENLTEYSGYVDGALVGSMHFILDYGQGNPVEVLALLYVDRDIVVEPQEPTESQLALAAEAAAEDASRPYERAIAICNLIENSRSVRGSGLGPLTVLANYFRSEEQETLDTSGGSFSVLAQPRFGTSEQYDSAGTGDGLSYVPNFGFRGVDAMTVVVELEGKNYKLVYVLPVETRLLDDEDQDRFCPRSYWRIVGTEEQLNVAMARQ